MRVCCFKINLSLEEAKNRYCDWMNEGIEFELGEYEKYIDKSIQIAEMEDGWTYFVDVKGEAFFGLSNESWMKFVRDSSVIYAYYDDDFNAELIVIKNGTLIREFSLYEDEPVANVDFGAFEYEVSSPIEDWNDVANFLEKELLFNI
ncbi:hypothetical protein CSE16_08320 [Solibacillus sp. R5-41]|uniref:hypothetical protein n=1 Tax=Solibacillus sp. R5-41 TaxID=2048654 RepID=UPI000C125056|nr:hypothetical protein [Solibacillus sp. R5-41]ATP40053.1 hypothetical protein CSE16_08320 [Solibacillus sp. R5-41]